jgi:membrane protein YdbS with pleckstrin-like domain
MKKGTRTWKLWFMMMIYCFSIIGVVGIYTNYFFNVNTDEIILMLATICTIILVAVFFTQLIKLLTRILKRKK